ncbi:hypothetical protein Mal64_38710 [Pseudobythopirellula maris]|uniref:Uncharacterized protein n=1 Tax=Pseudobythopirellula maris TaxID=2527991 RepID=A0A5C5ZGS9_9BACT|nr:hypothetical protein [Pseudobythopirellula maris]TWT86330.1 hypothetical protein Mal64_38710 [Pseudobythopirellula maris]
MNLFFLLFVLLAALLVFNAVKSFRSVSQGGGSKAKSTGIVSVVAAIAVVAVGHFLFNF